MATRLPLLDKTPFVLDERVLIEATSPHAGALSVSRVFRALRLPQLIEANLPLRKRKRGFSEAQMIETISLLQSIGGECPEDISLITGDECLKRGVGYEWHLSPTNLKSVSSVFTFGKLASRFLE